MSDHTPESDESPDEPLALGPVLPEADDRFVAGLLAASANPLPAVPAEVAARWDAALAEAAAERVGQASTPSAATTVIPQQRRHASRASRGARWAGIAASVAALALVGGVVANQWATDAGADGTVTEAAGALPTTDQVTTSGTAFNAQNVKSQATALIGRAAGTAARREAAPITLPATPESAATPADNATAAQSQPQNVTVAPAPEVQAFVSDANRRQACVENLAQRKGVKPVAVDMGYYLSEPAAMVVLVSEADPAKVDVYIVGTGCNLIDADVLYFTRVDVRR
jgi:hypothetical protein